MQKADAAAFLAKLSMREKESHVSPTNVHIISGEVSGESENGLSRISVDGLVFAEEDNQYVEMPTIGGLEDGDIASVLLIGEEGKQMTPLAVGAPGSVDRVKNLANSASSLAALAKSVADAINQFFWHDTNGAHVTQIPQEEWTDPENENYHSGPNALWNSLGMLFRNGTNNLLALVAGNNPGVQIYDGAGNANTNVAASMSADGVMLGQAGRSQTSLAPDGIRMTNPQHMTTFELAEGGKVSTEVSENFAQDLSWNNFTFSFSDAIAPGATIRVDLTGGMTDEGPLA